MNGHQPNQREAGALAISEVVRRIGREHRLSQARHARLLAETYAEPLARIRELLDLDLPTLNRILAIDGIHRCVECCHELHRTCMRDLSFEPTGIPIPCECDCT